VNSVKRVTDIISEISAASQEQAAGIDQVNKAVMQMDQGTQQNAALVEEATSASQSMKQQTAVLLDQVSFFKFEDTRKGRQVRTSEMSVLGTCNPQRNPHVLQGSRASQVGNPCLSFPQPGNCKLLESWSRTGRTGNRVKGISLRNFSHHAFSG